MGSLLALLGVQLQAGWQAGRGATMLCFYFCLKTREIGHGKVVLDLRGVNREQRLAGF